MQGIVINGICTEYVPAMDRGLHYGDGVFETIVCQDNRLQFWQQHMTRMRAGATILRLDFPGEETWLNDVRSLLEAGDAKRSLVIKLMLTRGVGERGYRVPRTVLPCRLAFKSLVPENTAPLSHQGARVTRCTVPLSVNSVLAGIKHLNRLDNVLARNEWQDEYDEGLMSDHKGNIIEGTMSNLFAVRAGTLYTPALENCGIHGIIRQQLLEIASEQNISLEVTTITHEALLQMDEIFLCNSVIGARPVTEYSGKEFLPGSITALLSDKLKKRIEDYAQFIG